MLLYCVAQIFPHPIESLEVCQGECLIVSCECFAYPAQDKQYYRQISVSPGIVRMERDRALVVCNRLAEATGEKCVQPRPISA